MDDADRVNDILSRSGREECENRTPEDHGILEVIIGCIRTPEGWKEWR